MNAWALRCCCPTSPCLPLSGALGHWLDTWFCPVLMLNSLIQSSSLPRLLTSFLFTCTKHVCISTKTLEQIIPSGAKMMGRQFTFVCAAPEALRKHSAYRLVPPLPPFQGCGVCHSCLVFPRIISLPAQHQRLLSYLHRAQFFYKLRTRCSSPSPFQDIMMGKCNTRFRFTPYRPRAENTIYLSLDCQAKLSASPDLPFFPAFLCLSGKS